MREKVDGHEKPVALVVNTSSCGVRPRIVHAWEHQSEQLVEYSLRHPKILHPSPFLLVRGQRSPVSRRVRAGPIHVLKHVAVVLIGHGLAFHAKVAYFEHIYVGFIAGLAESIERGVIILPKAKEVAETRKKILDGMETISQVHIS
jgi:hypothetical protein